MYVYLHFTLSSFPDIFFFLFFKRGQKDVYKSLQLYKLVTGVEGGGRALDQDTLPLASTQQIVIH